MKNYLLLLSILALGLTSCFKEDLPVPAYVSPEGVISNVAETGKLYENQVFFDLESNTFVKTVDRSIWDLAFTADAKAFHVFLNDGKFMSAANTNQTDFAKTNFDDLVWRYDNSNGNGAQTALFDWFELSENGITLNNWVYIIDRGYTADGNLLGKFKFQILDANNEFYRILVGTQTDGIGTEIIIGKNEIYNFSYFSFVNGGEVLYVAPPKTEYDLIFGQYTAKVKQITTGIIEDYSVNGVLLNEFETVATEEFLKPFSNVLYTDLENYAFTNENDLIGYNWKDYDFDLEIYNIYSNQVYLIETQEGNFFKLRFTGFVNEKGERGYPNFEFSKF